MSIIVADDTFKCILLNENNEIPNRISLKFVPGSPIANKPVRRQAITWTNPDPVHWRIYTTLGRDELNWNIFPHPVVPLAMVFSNINNNDILALAKLFFWRTGDKPFSEPMMA